MSERETTSRKGTMEQSTSADAEAIPFADRILDDLLPGELDWRRLVTSYPVASLAVAITGGFLLGRSRGTSLVTAFSAFALREVTKNVNMFLGDDAVEL